ncbi:unnamed protein product, partial [Discosporangium mesarthrocarpum]
FVWCLCARISSQRQSLERIFPCGLDMALIVDDRDDVWRGRQAANLLLVRPYRFFAGQHLVPGGPSHAPSNDSPPPSPTS